MKAQPEKYNIIILTLTLNMNIVIGDGNTFINNSELSNSNNTLQPEHTKKQEEELFKIIEKQNQEIIQLRQSLTNKESIIELLFLRLKKG
ncbi:hypothetical protein [Aureispira sp. CCB-E]|uniref:hypothetical protein n=1 Tax=Aureispira sp. CCB-E TaxID=3051121 RepID=UPI002868C385|nr:hypothetical protein [Aureispira sp. CCB-E]WMX15909.1 hypothetical protein QP953_05860 [Aureispira sp. CCB-E]